MRSRPGLLLALAAAVAVLVAAPLAAAGAWQERTSAAVRYAQTRAGSESFAYVDDRGRLRGHRAWVRAPSASLLKAMLLVAYLNRDSVRARALTDSDRSLLAPMIRWSDDSTATRVLGIVGAWGVDRVARRAGMRHFRLRSPWGLSETSARDQARFFYRIDALVPKRHRAYALRLLNTVVQSQRWGIPSAKPPGWKIRFKGGWGSGTGRVTHQSALLTARDVRLSLAILTQWNPSHRYGTQSVRGIAARILARPIPIVRD